MATYHSMLTLKDRITTYPKTSERMRKLEILERRPQNARRLRWFAMTRNGRMSHADWFTMRKSRHA